MWILLLKTVVHFCPSSYINEISSFLHQLIFLALEEVELTTGIICKAVVVQTDSVFVILSVLRTTF